MPTYSYRCANCDVAFDQYQAFTDESLTVCPNCGQSQLRKVFNSIGVSFTGSGFYRNDSRAEKSKDSSGSTPSSESASESASKSAPAPKSEAPTAKSESSSSPGETKAAKAPAAKSGTSASNSPSGSTGS